MTGKTTKQILIEARALVAAGWTQGVEARDAEGRPVYAWRPTSVRFSVAGALSHTQTRCAEARILLRCMLPRGGHSIEFFNDAPGRTQADVLALFDRAIESLEVAA